MEVHVGSFPASREGAIADVSLFPRRETEDHDRMLLQRMAAGDEQALAELYDRWHSFVHGVVSRIVCVLDDREDAVEVIFWQAWREAAHYDSSRGGVHAWLFLIARSRALDLVRTVGRRREDPLFGADGEDLAACVAESDPALDVENAERRVAVIAAIKALPVAQQQVTELAYFRGLSQTEIAERLSLPLGTVKTRLRLALQKLRRNLHTLADISGQRHFDVA